MKKIIAILTLAAAMLFACTGCGLFSDDSVVKFDDFTHKDPKGLTYDERIVLKGEGFDATLTDMMNQDAYPDSMVYDDAGNVIGMYDYDPETGLAKGWTNFSDGSYTEYAAGEEVDLGMPDASKMIEIPGNVSAGFVVYGNKEKTVSAYLYFFLTDASAKETVTGAVESLYGISLTEENDKVLKCVQNEEDITNAFNEQKEYGYSVSSTDAKAYADILKQIYGVKATSGANAMKPYADHKDPENLEFDERVVLTGSASAAVAEEDADYVTSMTEYIYGNQGNVVAEYQYFECPSKEDADKLLADKDNWNNTAERVSDTVVGVVITGKDMEDLVTTYIGYNVLKDRTLEDYVRMVQETYFTSIYE